MGLGWGIVASNELFDIKKSVSLFNIWFYDNDEWWQYMIGAEMTIKWELDWIGCGNLVSACRREPGCLWPSTGRNTRLKTWRRNERRSLRRKLGSRRSHDCTGRHSGVPFEPEEIRGGNLWFIDWFIHSDSFIHSYNRDETICSKLIRRSATW